MSGAREATEWARRKAAAERLIVIDFLHRSHGQVSTAARLAGIDRSTFEVAMRRRCVHVERLSDGRRVVVVR